MKNEVPFILRSPFTDPNQKAQAIKANVASIQKDLQYIHDHGHEEFMKKQPYIQTNNDDDNDSTASTEENNHLGSSFDGSLRDYQIYMLERAKVENTIVHLGTGMGKTLISIFLIKDFLSRRNKNDNVVVDDLGNIKNKSHILFLVPSIALAVQHTGKRG